VDLPRFRGHRGYRALHWGAEEMSAPTSRAPAPGPRPRLGLTRLGGHLFSEEKKEVTDAQDTSLMRSLLYWLFEAWQTPGPTKL
jgi:hypothetical protein